MTLENYENAVLPLLNFSDKFCLHELEAAALLSKNISSNVLIRSRGMLSKNEQEHIRDFFGLIKFRSSPNRPSTSTLRLKSSGSNNMFVTIIQYKTLHAGDIKMVDYVTTNGDVVKLKVYVGTK